MTTFGVPGNISGQDVFDKFKKFRNTPGLGTAYVNELDYYTNTPPVGGVKTSVYVKDTVSGLSSTYNIPSVTLINFDPKISALFEVFYSQVRNGASTDSLLGWQDAFLGNGGFQYVLLASRSSGSNVSDLLKAGDGGVTTGTNGSKQTVESVINLMNIKSGGAYNLSNKMDLLTVFAHTVHEMYHNAYSHLNQMYDQGISLAANANKINHITVDDVTRLDSTYQNAAAAVYSVARQIGGYSDSEIQSVVRQQSQDYIESGKAKENLTNSVKVMAGRELTKYQSEMSAWIISGYEGPEPLPPFDHNTMDALIDARIISKVVAGGDKYDANRYIIRDYPPEAKKYTPTGSVVVEPDQNNFIEIIANEIVDGVEWAFDFARDFLAAYAPQIGSQLGSYFSRVLFKGEVAQNVSSVLFSTLGNDLGEAFSATLKGADFGKSLEAAFENFGRELELGAEGQISSVLTAELIQALGLEGTVVGDLGQGVASSWLTQVMDNLTHERPPLENVSVDFYTIGATYLGNKLADAIYSPSTAGGQIGSQIGSMVGSADIAYVFAALGFNPVAAAIAVIAYAIDKIIYTLIGDLLNGTPKSGVTLSYDSATGQFSSHDVWAKNGASRKTIRGIADPVGDFLAQLIEASSGVISSSIADMEFRSKKKTFTVKSGEVAFSSKDPTKVIAAGEYFGISDIYTKIIGGDIFVKRALANIAQTSTSASFDPNRVVGDLAVASDYENYLANSTVIQELFLADPNSGFAVGWMLTLARAAELGLNKRSSTDFTGGWNAVLDYWGDGKVDGSLLHPGQLYTFMVGNERTFDYVDANGALLWTAGDTIQTSDKDIIDGTAGNDVLTVTGHTLTGASGVKINGAATSTDFQISVAAVINAGAGNDTVRAGDLGNDVLGGDGADVLIGGKLDDWLFGEAGDDVLFAGNVSNTSFLIDNLTAEQAAVAVDGGNGNLLDGGDGDDRVYGGKGSDWLKGGAGNDRLVGGDGGDILEGGAGDDQGAGGAPAIFGGGGTDQYVFGFGDGIDVIFDESDPNGTVGSTGDSLNVRYDAINAGTLARNWAGGGDYEVDGSIRGGEDAIAFGPGVTMANLRITRSSVGGVAGQDLIIQLTAEDETGATVLTGDKLIIKDWFESTRRIEWFRFTNGDEVRFGDVVNFSIGSDAADTILGTMQGDFLVGGAGNDWIRSMEGNDFAFGSSGDDSVFGEEDNDFVGGGMGNDLVHGGGGNDTVFGDDGDDIVLGGAGADILVGGKGNDRIVTGAGNDLVRFARGDGRDVVIDDLTNDWEQVIHIEGGVQTLASGYSWVGDSIVKDGVVYFDGTHWINGDFNWNFAAGDMKRHIDSTVYGNTTNNGQDTVEFAVGIDIQDLMLRRVGRDFEVAIGDSDSNASFDDVADRLTFTDWSNFIYGGQSIEFFSFAAVGKITLANYFRSDWSPAGTEGADIIYGTGDADWITGNGGDDSIYAHGGNDIVNGNAGDDILGGADGDDILYGGAGNDTLQGHAGADHLFGGAGIDYASYDASWSEGVYVYLSNPEFNTGVAVGDTFDSIEGLMGSQVDDRLGGDAGDNFLRGNAGNDLLMGGAGDDTYEWSMYTHMDTIKEGVLTVTASGVESVGSGDGGDDMIVLDVAGLGLAGLAFEWVSNDLEIWVNGSAAFYILDQTNADHAVESLQLSYGLTIDLTALRLAGAAGTSGVDMMFGGGSADTLSALAGNDLLFGAGGADTLSGGAGDDLIEGGTGADVIDGGSDSETEGLAIDGVSAWGDTVSYASSSAGVTVNLATGAASGGDAQGDTIVMSGGVSTIENIVGSQFDDTLTGDARANRFSGLDGDDYIVGGAGDDVVSGGAGDDFVQDTSGDNVISGDDGDDYVYAGSGKDIILGGVGMDELSGGGGDDQLDGSEGDDGLYGDDGNDIIIGGTGDDYLEGGQGNDTFVFDAASGDDIIWDAYGANHIVLQDVTADQVWFSRSGSDLIISVIGGDTTINLAGYYVVGGNPTIVRDIQLQDRILYLALSEDLITAMATASPSATPTTMPSGVAALLDTYWISGANSGPAVVNQSFTMLEDGAPHSGTVNAQALDAAITGYSLSRASGLGEVTVNATTGAWTFTPTPDANGHDTFEITVTDANGGHSVQIITVNITAVNDAPSDIVASNDLQVLFGSAAGTPFAILQGIDVDDTDFTYTLTDNAGGKFTIDNDGTLQTASGSIPLGTYSITAQVSDSHLVTYTKTFTVTVTDGQHAPNAPVAGAIPIFAEGALTGTTVTTFTLTDPDGPTPAPTLETVSDPDSDSQHLLQVDGVALKFNGPVDFEALVAAGFAHADTDADGVEEVAYTVKVRANDGGLTSDVTTITIRIEDANEAPTAINASSLAASIAERDHLEGDPTSLPAINLATLTTVDPDVLTSAFRDIVYTVDDTARFEVVGGVLRLKADVKLDFETSSSVSVKVTAHDRGSDPSGLLFDRTFTFLVTNVDDYLYGTAGADTIVGGANRDIIDGGENGDTLIGGAGDDLLIGGAGDDILIGGAGADHFNGSDDYDRVSYVTASTGVTVDLVTGARAGDATGDVFEDLPEELIGSAYNDTIVGALGVRKYYGGAGNDAITGSNSDEELFGGAGDDVLDAKGGNDQLTGGTGHDVMIGGSGDDTYRIGRNDGADDIYNLDHAYDVIGYDSDVTREDLWFAKSADGNDLVVTVVGTSTVTTIKNWFVDALPPDDNKIDLFVADTHYSVSAENLVDLMDHYSATPPIDRAAFDALRAANTGFQGAWDAMWHGNNPPKITDSNDGALVTQTVDEDGTVTLQVKITDDITVPSGIVVGAKGVKASDYTVDDNSIVTAADLSGPDSFGVRTLTIQLQPNASGQAAIKITAQDAGGVTKQEVFLLNVTAVADAPVLNPSLAFNTFANGPVAFTVGHLADQDCSEDLLVTISGLTYPDFELSAGSRSGSVWTLTKEDLVGLTLKGPAGFHDSLSLTITATATEKSNGSTATTTIMFSPDINAAPTDITVPPGALSINENTTGQFTSFSGADPDGGVLKFYFDAANPNSNPGGLLSLAEDGSLSVSAGVNLDYDTMTTRTWDIVVKVVDSGGLYFLKTFTINVLDVDEAPVWSSTGDTVTLNENTANSTVVGTFTARDPEGLAITYELVSSPAFAINSSTGQVTVANSALLDFEKTPPTLTIRATAGGQSTDKLVPITLYDVNEPITKIDVGDPPIHLNENSVNGTLVRTAVAADQDTTDTITYSLTQGGDAFQIGSDGRITVKDSSLLNYETQTSRDITVHADDGHGHELSATYTVLIDDVPEAPVFNNGGQTIHVSEFTDVTAPVGWTASATDPDNGSHTLTYSVDHEYYNIDASSGVLFLKKGLDYENTSVPHSQSVTVKVTDETGQWSTTTLNLITDDYNEKPVFDDPNSPALTAHDPEGGPVTYTIESVTGPTIKYIYGWTSLETVILHSYDDQKAVFTVFESNGQMILGYDEGYTNGSTPNTVTVRVSDQQGNYVLVTRNVTFPGIAADGTPIWPPVVLDLDGDGIELVSAATSSVRFDMDSDGKTQHTGWVGADDGFLVLDRNGDGKITNGQEISFVADKPGATSDLEGLQAFDSNGDGRLDAADARFTDFQVWRDANQDGVSQDDELFSLTDAGIAAIELNGQKTGADPNRGNDNVLYATSSFTRADGSTGAVGDVFLAYAKNRSSPPEAGAGEVNNVIATPEASAEGRAAVMPGSMAAQAEDWQSRWDGLFGGAKVERSDVDRDLIGRVKPAVAANAEPDEVDRSGSHVNTAPDWMVAQAKTLAQANRAAAEQAKAEALSPLPGAQADGGDDIVAARPLGRSAQAPANDPDELAGDLADLTRGYTRSADYDLDSADAAGSSALDQQLALASQMRFRMVEAMSAFAPTPFMADTQTGRMKDVEADKLLTALPDYRIVANG